MGLLKDSARGESPDLENDPVRAEENYERLFMKIGRDFVHKDDLDRIVKELTNKISLISLRFAELLEDDPIDTKSDIGALSRAYTYKLYLDEGKDGSKVYPDLIDLSDED